MKSIRVLALLLPLTACSGIPMTAGNPGLYTLPKGTVLRLNQPLRIPARQVRTGIQYGKPTLGVDKWDPYCEFVVNTVPTEQVTVPVGVYTVTKVRRAQIPYAGTSPDGGRMVASANEASAWLTQASPSYAWLYMTTLRLESTTFPDARQLECGAVFGTGYEARHITIKEFEATVGDVVTLMTTSEKK